MARGMGTRLGGEQADHRRHYQYWYTEYQITKGAIPMDMDEELRQLVGNPVAEAGRLAAERAEMSAHESYLEAVASALDRIYEAVEACRRTED